MFNRKNYPNTINAKITILFEIRGNTPIILLQIRGNIPIILLQISGNNEIRV